MRRAYRGSNIVLFIGVFLSILLASVMAIDLSYYYAAQNEMQTAADAAALAATQRLFENKEPASNFSAREDDVRQVASDLNGSNLPGSTLETEDVELGFIDPATMAYDPSNFSDPNTSSDYDLTGGYNAVRVIVKRTEDSNGPLPTIMANLLGIPSMDAVANSTAIMNQNIASINDGGLRPVYACEAQVNQAFADGNPSNNVARIYGQQFYLDGATAISGCPTPGSGNWGFADFTECTQGAIGNSTMTDWFTNGYPGVVNAGQCYSTQPGNALSSNGVETALDNLIANQTVIALPVISTFNGNGSNTSVMVNSFTGFVITGYDAQAPADSRYIEGYFTRMVCTTGCTNGSNAPSAGAITLRLAPRDN